jgi:hypothetical protein
LQRGLLYGAAEESTIGSGPAPWVIEAPWNVAVVEPAVSVSVDWNVRVCVDAATVVTHGLRWFRRPRAWARVPAEAATNTPAAYASRKDNSTGSVNGSVPPEMEKLSTFAPSRIACCTAAAESESKQPWIPQTL